MGEREVFLAQFEARNSRSPVILRLGTTSVVPKKSVIACGVGLNHRLLVMSFGIAQLLASLFPANLLVAFHLQESDTKYPLDTLTFEKAQK